MSYSDDDLARELRRELQGNLVPFDPARAQYMIDEAIAASPVRRVLRSRWAMPLLASGAVAAVVGGVAGATALQPDGKPAHPGGGPTVAVSPSPPTTTAPLCPTLPPTPPRTPPRMTSSSAPGLPPRHGRITPSAPSALCAYTLPGTPTSVPAAPTVSPTGPAQPPTESNLPPSAPSTAPTPTMSSAPLPPQATVPPSPSSLTPMPGRG